jgi:hypothetical protein
VLVDSNGIVTSTPNTETAAKKTDESSGTSPASVDEGASRPSQNKDSKGRDKDDVFSDSEAEETGSSKSRQAEAASAARGTVINTTSSSETKTNSDQIASVSRETEHLSLGNTLAQHRCMLIVSVKVMPLVELCQPLRCPTQKVNSRQWQLMLLSLHLEMMRTSKVNKPGCWIVCFKFR